MAGFPKPGLSQPPAFPPNAGGFFMRRSLPPIAGAADGHDVVRSQLAAQIPHVDVHDVRARIEVESPNPAEELLPAEYLVGVADKLFRQSKFSRREIVNLPIGNDAPGSKVEFQTAHGE